MKFCAVLTERSRIEERIIICAILIVFSVLALLKGATQNFIMNTLGLAQRTIIMAGSSAGYAVTYTLFIKVPFSGLCEGVHEKNNLKGLCHSIH